MTKSLLIILLIYAFPSKVVLAQDPGDYILTVDLIEVCGNGDNDTGSGEEYRWKLEFKGPGQTNFQYGTLVGVTEATPSSCFNADNNIAIGPSLPHQVFSAKYNTSMGLDYLLQIKARGYEKDCFGSNSYNGDDKDFVSPCNCGVLGSVPCPEKNDDDLRDVILDFSIDLNNLVPGEYSYSDNLRIEQQGDNKYTFKLRYTWSPPVPSAPFLSGQSSLCSGEALTINVNEPYPVEKYIWYENTNFETYQICDELDQNCANQKINDCFNCDPMQGPCDCACSDCLNDPNSQNDCLTECSDCLICRDEYVWNYLGTSASNQLTVSAPLITDDFQFKQYKVHAIGKNHIGSNYDSPEGALLTIYPRAPSVSNIPLNNSTSLTDINWFEDNNSVRIEHVKCKGSNSGSIQIKSIDEVKAGNGLYNFRLYKNNIQVQAITSVQNISTTNPVKFNNLSKGIYLLRIINSWNNSEYCFNEYEIAIKEPNLAVSVSNSNPNAAIRNGYHISCNGKADGLITIQGSGGLGNYAYSFNGGSFSSNNAFDDLSSGNYNYTTLDELGCSASGTVSVTEPTKLAFTSIPSPNSYLHEGSTYHISCYNGSDGSITVSAKNGIPDYQYELFYSDNTNTGKPYSLSNRTFSGLKANSYITKVTDANGCSIESKIINLFHPLPINLESPLTQYPECIGGSDGSVQFTPSGGISPYTFSSLGKTTTGITGNLTGFSSGNHEVLIQDSKGCTTTFPFTIPINPAPLNLEYVSNSPPVCPDTPTATVSLKANNGFLDSGKYSITVNEIQLQGGENESITFTDLYAGTYTAEVKDNYSPSCNASVTFTIPNLRSDKLQLVESWKKAPSCYSYADGSIAVNATGGDGPYTFSFEGLTYSDQQTTDFIVNNLTANSAGYRFYVRDTNAENWGELCEVMGIIRLGQPDPLGITSGTTSINCYRGNDGIIELLASGGNGGYTYHTYDYETDELVSRDKIISDLSSGYYQSVIGDKNNCPEAVTFAELRDPPPVKILDYIPTNPNCSNNNGSVKIIAAGGTGVLQYELNGDTNTSGFFGDLSEGQYVGFVNDENGCEQAFSFELQVGIPKIEVNHLKPSCSETIDGIIKITPLYGSSPFMYSINGGPFNYNNTFENLSSGIYRISGKDNNGCLTEEVEVNLLSPSPIQLNITEIDPASCHLPDGQIYFEISGGNIPYTNSIFSTNGKEAENGSLEEGSYTLLTTDDSGCSISQNFEIPSSPSPIFDLETLSNDYCGLSTGQAQVVVHSTDSKFGFLWLSGETGSRAFKLESGFNSVTVTDLNTLCSTKEIFRIESEEGLGVTYVSENSNCNKADGSISLTIEGGHPPYDVFWKDFPEVEGLETQNISAGIYEVLITDSLGCSKTVYPFVNNESGPMILDIDIIEPYCDRKNGKVKVSTDASNPKYFWDGSDSGHNSSDEVELESGEHLLTIVDGNGCQIQERITLMDNPEYEFMASVEILENEYCNLDVGKIQIFNDGGVGPFSYYLDETKISNPYEGLSAGDYLLEVVDKNGCTSEVDFNIPRDPEPSLSMVENNPANCSISNGHATVAISNFKELVEINWSNGITGTENKELSAGRNWVFGMDSKGCATDTIFFLTETQNSLSAGTFRIIPPTCSNSNDGFIELTGFSGGGELSYQWNTGSTAQNLENIISGTYKVKVQDENGCEIEKSIEVAGPKPLEFSHVEYRSPSCFGDNDGSIEVFVSGGTRPYNYFWGNGARQKIANNLSAGSYSLEITDKKGCSISSNFNLEEPTPLIDTGIPQLITICTGQSLEVTPLKWSTYQWELPNGETSVESTIIVDEAGSYILKATSTKGCEVSDTLLVDIRNDILNTELVIPSKAILLDTVVAVDISWPEPENVRWLLPDGLNVISINNERLEFTSGISGKYDVTVETILGDCFDSDTKTIELLAPDLIIPGGRAEKLRIEKFEVYPNPSHGAFSIEIKLNIVSEIFLDLLDLYTGESFKSIEQPPSIFHEVNLEKIPAGPVAVILKAGSVQSAKRVIIK